MNKKVKRLRAIVDELATIGFDGDDDAIARDDILSVLSDLEREQGRMHTRARFYLFTEQEEAMRAEIKTLLVASGEWGDGAENSEVRWSEWVGKYGFNGLVLPETLREALDYARGKYDSRVR